MPTYTVKYSNLSLSQKQKNLLANDISKIHSKFTGANTFFAQVIFQKNQKNAHFMGGKLVKTKEIFLIGQIRAGRTSKVKKQLILDLRKVLIKNTMLHRDFVWVYLEDLLPNQMIEYGQILPKSGQEKKWFNSLSTSLRKILIKNTKLQSDFVWVYLEDLLPNQMIEYGEVLPKSGQEKKWFNSLSSSLRKRLKKMEK